MHFEYQIMKKTVFEYETLRMRDREFQTFSQLVLYLCIYVKKIGHVWKKNLNLNLRSLLNVMLLKKNIKNLFLLHLQKVSLRWSYFFGLPWTRESLSDIDEKKHFYLSSELEFYSVNMKKNI